MKIKKSYVAALGHVTADQYYRCLQKIVVGDKFFVRHIETLPGGMVANTACVLAALGTPTKFLSALGTDSYTRMLLQSFESFNVSIDSIDVLTSCENFKTAILMEADGSDRTIMLYENREKPVAVIDAEKELLLREASFVYGLISDFKTLDNYRELLGAAKTEGACFMFDAESSTFVSKDDINDRYFFDLADVLSFNTEAADKYCGRDGDSAFVELIGDSEKIVIITQGARGCSVLWRDGRVDIPSYSVEAVDTTGAGDTFNAAFLHALIQDHDIPYCSKFATAAANRSVQFIGARSGAVSQRMVTDFIESRSK